MCCVMWDVVDGCGCIDYEYVVVDDCDEEDSSVLISDSSFSSIIMIIPTHASCHHPYQNMYRLLLL